MFTIVADEIRAWVWMIRAKVAGTIALLAVTCGNRALRRIEAQRSAPFSLRAAGLLLALSRRILPKPLNNTVDELTRRQFGDPRG